MARSEGLDGVVLGAADIAGGLALSVAAGWNQIADDWAFFISQGHASGFRSAADGLVATTAAVVYGGGSAWISMVLVAEAWRHRGLASLLLERTLRRLEALHATPMLDARRRSAATTSRACGRESSSAPTSIASTWCSLWTGRTAPTSPASCRRARGTS